jgi:chromatin segregation and condensation protein Rec8/ScpA/Scc1 (kleisin family)
MEEKDIVDLISKDYTWEQIIYQVVAWEGMDPWNVDLVSFADYFLKFIKRAKELDFRVPAKYIIISSVLLRMKSDHLHFLDVIHGGEDMVYEEPNVHDVKVERVEINPITMPARRQPKSRVAVSELVDALKKVLKSEEKRKVRGIRRRQQIVIDEEDISKRIDEVYSRIKELMGKMKGEEVKFSKLIDRCSRKEVADTFLPLLHLDNEKKVDCRQENVFDEIFIRKR